MKMRLVDGSHPDHIHKDEKASKLKQVPRTRRITTAEKAKLLRRATEVLGARTAAEQWLINAVPIFGGITPLEYAAKHGVDEVFKILGRIEHGVWS